MNKNSHGTKERKTEKRGRKGSRMRNLSEALYMELREHRSSFIVYFTSLPYSSYLPCR